MLFVLLRGNINKPRRKEKVTEINRPLDYKIYKKQTTPPVDGGRGEPMFCELMGICFSCRRPTTSRLNNKISEHISASVTPLHVCLEEQRGPELGSCDVAARKPQVRLVSVTVRLNVYNYRVFIDRLKVPEKVELEDEDEAEEEGRLKQRAAGRAS